MIVVDASVGFKWLFTFNESFLQQANNILEGHLEDKEKIVVPDIFFYEIANTAVTKSLVPEKQVVIIINKLFSFDIAIKHLTKMEILDTAKLAKKYKTSVYDMLYAVVAKENKTILVTADENFIQKTGFKFVKHLKDF